MTGFKHGDDISPGQLERMSDEEIQQAVFNRFDDMINTIVRFRGRQFRLNSDDAEDCLMHVYINLFDDRCRRIRAFAGKCSFKSYLGAICDHIILDHIRNEIRIRDKNVRHDTEDIDGRIYGSEDGKYLSPEREYIENEKHAHREDAMRRYYAMLTEAFSALPPEEYSALNFRFFQNKKYEEINTLMNIDNASYVIRRALKRIKNRLGDEGYSIYCCISEEIY